MKNKIKENKLMITGIIGYIALIIFALNINVENNQIKEDLFLEKKNKEEIRELFYYRSKLLSENKSMEKNKEEIDEDIKINLQLINKAEHIIRCKQKNEFLEIKDDCKTNWKNYPK